MIFQNNFKQLVKMKVLIFSGVIKDEKSFTFDRFYITYFNNINCFKIEIPDMLNDNSRWKFCYLTLNGGKS